MSGRELRIEEIQKLALRQCGRLMVLPLSLQEGQTYNCLLGLMLLWFSSGFESDLDSTKKQRHTYGFCLSPVVTPLTVPGNYVRPFGILWNIWLLNSVDSLEGKWGQKDMPKIVIVLSVLRDTVREFSEDFFWLYIFWDGLLGHLVISLPFILCYMVFIIKTEAHSSLYNGTCYSTIFPFPWLALWLSSIRRCLAKVKVSLKKKTTCGSTRNSWDVQNTAHVHLESLLCSSKSVVKERFLTTSRLL